MLAAVTNHKYWIVYTPVVVSAWTQSNIQIPIILKIDENVMGYSQIVYY